MARRPRFIVPGVPHHVTQRGNNRQDVFFSDQDRLRYLELLRQHCRRYDVRVLAWCLMTNHVHLILIPGSAESLALTLGQLHSQYALEQNRQRRRVGHLWQNRFFSCVLESAHLLAALHYVELNPVRAGITPAAGDWPWSSARTHLNGSPARVAGLAVDRLDGGNAAGLEPRGLERGFGLGCRGRSCGADPADHAPRRTIGLGCLLERVRSRSGPPFEGLDPGPPADRESDI